MTRFNIDPNLFNKDLDYPLTCKEVVTESKSDKTTTHSRSSADFSFVSVVERITLLSHQGLRERSVVVAEVVSRLAALLLSPAAALDIAFHTIHILPTFIYAIGKSIYLRTASFTLPWQHLQRVRNAVMPLLLGSAFGVIHPFAGILMSEPTDKHAVLGMLTSNTGLNPKTPCSPIHSLSIIEDIAKKHSKVKVGDRNVEIYTPQHIAAIQSAKDFEKNLESLQAQEFIHKITNVTVMVMYKIVGSLGGLVGPGATTQGAILTRLAGVLVPVLTVVDVAIALIVHSIFLIAGVAQTISGRSFIYTEITSNPLMQLNFLAQNVCKALGLLVGTAVWFVSPPIGFMCSLYPGTLFYNMQMSLMMQKLKLKMYLAKENDKIVLPIVFSRSGEVEILSAPVDTMHKTYLILEKKGNDFNLYWINRPSVSQMKNLSKEEAVNQVRRMFEVRFPFMNLEKMMQYPVKADEITFATNETPIHIPGQGTATNCPVSNMFGTLEMIDKLNGIDAETTRLRYEKTRAALRNDYSFYRGNFSPFAEGDDYDLENTWDHCANHSDDPI